MACDHADLYVSPTEIYSYSEGGTFQIYVFNAQELKVEPDKDWITTSVKVDEEHAGNAEVTVQIAPASSKEVTTGNIVITDTKQQQAVTVAVTREGRNENSYITISPIELAVSSDGGQYKIQVNCEGKWTVDKDVNWVSVNPGVGSGNGTFTLTVEPSDKYETTMAELRVSSFGGSKDVTAILHVTRAALEVKTFFVSAVKQVIFSTGNLQYKASTNEWRFAEEQYDIIGEGNRYIGEYNSGWIDLFGWGAGNNGVKPYQSSTDNNLYAPIGQDIAGTPYDWGYERVLRDETLGIESDQWRTLTYEEWKFIIDNRKYSTFAKIKGVYGLLMLPDGVEPPETVKVEMTQGSTMGLYAVTKYSDAEWKLLKSVGAVFLPCGGYRDGTTVIMKRIPDGLEIYSGSYWSSTSHYKLDADESYKEEAAGIGFLFSETDEAMMISPVYSDFSQGQSVRLVKDF